MIGTYLRQTKAVLRAPVIVASQKNAHSIASPKSWPKGVFLHEAAGRPLSPIPQSVSRAFIGATVEKASV